MLKLMNTNILFGKWEKTITVVGLFFKLQCLD